METENEPKTTFKGQNARAKIRLELPNGILIEVPLALVIRAIHEQYLIPQDKTKMDMGVPDLNDERRGMLILTVEKGEPMNPNAFGEQLGKEYQAKIERSAKILNAFKCAMEPDKK